MKIPSNFIRTLVFFSFTAVALLRAADPAPKPAADTVKQEHADINMAGQKTSAEIRNQHPDAQWFPEAGLGLFIHWGICTVKGLNISWSMIDGLNGRRAQITPNEYFALAKDFRPQHYNPDRWLKAAKDAGFTYAVLTTRHHEGFALWPSKFGDFDTDNHLAGQDFVRGFVDACRRHGLKVGFYYSPPHWQFEKDFKNFNYNKKTTPLDADLKPRTAPPAEDELKKLHAGYATLIRGQMEELLKNYGKVDVLWFDGRPPGVPADQIISREELLSLQPSVVINPRFHGRGDFITYERNLRTNVVASGRNIAIPGRLTGAMSPTLVFARLASSSANMRSAVPFTSTTCRASDRPPRAIWSMPRTKTSRPSGLGWQKTARR
jgi:alpha-L-fucosidase